MAVIRRTEKAAYDLFLAGLVKGTTHLASGHEAVAVGASAALRPDDYVFATYRGHHHAMARGATPEACLAELMQKATGLCKAKGGSMHLTQAAGNMLGSYAIVGAHLPMAVGAAWSATAARHRAGGGGVLRRRRHQHRRVPRGAQPGRGVEAAGDLRLREQPLHGVHADRRGDRGRPPGGRPGRRLPACRPRSSTATTWWSVRDAVAAAADAGAGRRRARRSSRRETYRHYGHSRTDPAKYRPAEEVERWLKHDPIDVARARLEALGVDPGRRSRQSTSGPTRRGRRRDRRRPRPPRRPTSAEAFTDVWADGGAAWRT